MSNRYGFLKLTYDEGQKEITFPLEEQEVAEDTLSRLSRLGKNCELTFETPDFKYGCENSWYCTFYFDDLEGHLPTLVHDTVKYMRDIKPIQSKVSAYTDKTKFDRKVCLSVSMDELDYHILSDDAPSAWEEYDKYWSSLYLLLPDVYVKEKPSVVVFSKSLPLLASALKAHILLPHYIKVCKLKK